MTLRPDLSPVTHVLLEGGLHLNKALLPAHVTEFRSQRTPLTGGNWLMCSRPTSTYRFAYLCRAPPLGSIETHSFPNSLVACPGDFTLITRTARACASYPCCVAIYPRSRSRRVLCRWSLQLHSLFRGDQNFAHLSGSWQSSWTL